MPDLYSQLWGDDDGPFWTSLKMTILVQNEFGTGTCVPTSLAIIASAISRVEVLPTLFMQGDLAVNTQSPQDWSDKLQTFGAQLAYCNFDSRNLENYITELIEYEDLFMIGFYSDMPVRDAAAGSSTGGSHMVTMYKDEIYDTKTGIVCDASEYPQKGCMVKRIFRVVPKDHSRKV